LLLPYHTLGSIAGDKTHDMRWPRFLDACPSYWGWSVPVVLVVRGSLEAQSKTAALSRLSYLPDVLLPSEVIYDYVECSYRVPPSDPPPGWSAQHDEFAESCVKDGEDAESIAILTMAEYPALGIVSRAWIEWLIQREFGTSEQEGMTSD
jgi:hypothetical protein